MSLHAIGMQYEVSRACGRHVSFRCEWFQAVATYDGTESEDGRGRDDGGKLQESHADYSRGLVSFGSNEILERCKLTGNEDHKPDGVNRNLVGGEAGEKSTVGQAVVPAEGVERTSWWETSQLKERRATP